MVLNVNYFCRTASGVMVLVLVMMMMLMLVLMVMVTAMALMAAQGVFAHLSLMILQVIFFLLQDVYFVAF